MNHISTLTRSRWLLLTLFTLLVGVSPAWAQQALPYSYGFEDNNLATDGWTTSNLNNSSYIYNYEKRTGSYCFRFYYNSNPPQYLISPELTVSAGAPGVDITFYYKTPGNYGPEKFKVGYSTTTNTVDAFTEKWETEITTSTTEWTKYTATFPAETKYICIAYTANNKYYLYIDDIVISQTPNCITPTGLTTSNITTTSVDLSWTSAADEWNIQYKRVSDGDWTDVSGKVTDNPYTLSGLSQNTNYQVRVRTYCNNVDQSDWTEPISFTTKQTAVDLTTGSFADDFESGNNWAFVNGNLTNAWAIGSATNNGGTKSMYISNNGGTSNAYTNNSETMVYATKLFTLAAGKYDISYDWKGNGESTYDYMRAAIVPAATVLTAGTSVPSGFSTTGLPSGWIAIDGGGKLNVSSTFANKAVEATIPEAGNYMVVFGWRNDTSTGNNPPAAIDNFSIALQTCPKPTGLTASNPTWQGATLAWTAGSDETEWKIIYGAAGFDPASEGTTIDNVTTNPYTLTGLTQETTYDVYVKAVKGGDVSVVSNKATFTTTERYPAPTGLAINNLTTTSATLTWNAAGESSWEVAINTTGATPATAAGTGTVVNAATFDFSGLTTETTYYAFVRVKDGENFSAWSTACEFTPSAAVNLTVYDDTDTNSYFPVYLSGDYNNAHARFIIPSTALEDVQNGSIKKLTFYSNQATTALGNFIVYVAETDITTFNSEDVTNYDGMTQVYTGSLSVSGNKMVVEFTDPFAYTNKNLVIAFKQTAKSYNSCTWYGKNQASSTARRKAGSYSAQNAQFLPKTTINYIPYVAPTNPVLQVYDGETELTESPAAFDFGFVPAGTTHTFTLKNTAATSYTATVSSANLTVDPTTAITPDADGETFTVTMPNHDINNEPVVITPEDGKGLNAFTINVSGRYRDASKIFVDFTNDAIPTAWTASKWYRSSYNGYIYDDGTTAESHAELTTSRIVSTNENLTLSAKLKTDAGILNVWWSADGTEWLDGNKTELKAQFNTTEFTSVNVNVPTAAKYVKFEGYNAYIKSIYGLADAPLMKVRKTAEGANLSTPQTVDFGLTASADAETFYVVNASAGSLAGVDAVLTGTGFTLNKTNLSDDGGNFTIAVDTEVKGYREATVTVSSTNQDDFVINLKGFVSGADGKMYVDFNDNQLPANWKNADTNPWEFADGKAHTKAGNTGNSLLTTCKLTVAADEVLAIKAMGDNSYSELKVHVYQNGEEITAKKMTFDSQIQTNKDNYTTLYFTGLAAGDYKLVFEGWKVYIDEIAGFTVNPNDPELKVYSDALANQEVATVTTKDFGWVADDADAAAFTSTYYIKNNGTGTLTISNISEVEGFTAATAENATTVSGENTLALTITMDKNAVGAKSGTFTLTTNGGNFTIPVKGFVYGNRNLIDFSSAAQTAGWNKGTWTIDENVASVAAASTMQTTSFIVNANEKLYVEAKRTADNYSTGSLSYSYSINNGESWTYGEAALFSATGSSDYDTYTICDIAGNEERTVLIRFNGAYAAINRIYGFEAIHVAEMVVSQTEAIAFGMQTAETTETSFTISNANGSKTLEGLSVTLGKTGEDAEYEVRMEKDDAAFTGTEIAVGEVVTVYVKQLFDINKLGAKSDVLTIAATDQTPVAINLSGATRDASKLYVDFDGSNDWPSAVASHGANWEVYAGYARQNSATASSLVLAPLTISNASEALRFKASRNGNDRDLKVRYTTNGGVTWNDYNFGTNETPVISLKEQITSSFSDFEITNISAGTVAFDFYGQSVKLDNITADYRLTTAPLVAFTTVTDNISDANLTANADATYTLANIGNANYVGTVNKSNVDVAISGEDVTYEGNTLTIPAGKTAEITVTMPFAAPYGEKNGSMTITSESWVGDVAVNYTANLIDPDAINVDFASAPAGWYNAGWTVNGTANIYSGVEKELITEQFAAEAGKNVLSFKAKAQSGNEGTLKVYTSTDRKTWSEPKEFTLSGEYATKSLAALADGNYYVKFVSLNANIDDLTGLKKIAAAPEHDLYVSTSNIPTATKVPETSITATATVYSLRANEEGVSAKLFFDNVEVAAADAQDISKDGSVNFTLTGNVPATEKTYAAKIVVYYGGNSVAFETLTTNVEVQHTRTLAITAFERVGEGDLSADVDNKITAQFNVTVQNNSTCNLTADEVKVSIVNAAGEIYQMNDADNVTAATAVLAKDASVVIPVTLTISAGEGGDFKFRAKELVSNTTTLEANDITIHVNAQAPQFALNIKGGAALADGDDVAFGLVKEATTKQYTISNTGTKALVLTSIVAPAGYSVTEINNDNKTIAANGTLDIDVTLLAEQGKKAGDLVFTYDVNGTPTTFTLALTGRSEAANVWEEYFTSEIPATWQKTGWTWNSDRQTAYSGGVQGEFTLMTPRLSAAAGQVLTYETKWQYDGDDMTVQYSTDKTSWTDYETVTASTETVEHQFVAPAAGDYYLKFTANRYVNLDNFIGFALNIPEHDMELAASNVPTTGKRLNSYVATVTLKENAGKNEDITAELWVDGAKVNAIADVSSVEANSNAAVVTLTWEPQTTLDGVNAYVKVTYAGGTLETTPVTLTIAEVYTLSENSTGAVEAVTNETVMLQRSFAAGWNTICLPFAVADKTAIEALFGAGAKVFNFKNFANSMIEFEAVTSMAAATPYLIYVPAAVTEPIRVNNVTISSLNTTAETVRHNNITFQGSYAPVAAGGLNGKYGVTTANKLAKGNANTTMKGFRAYFEGSLAGARIYTFDDATGISHVYQAAEVFGDDDRVYNMNGQHVENAKKGVYIVNGKKVVIK